MPKKGIELTFEYVNELLTYVPNTGHLRWKKDAGSYGRIKAGTIAGSIDPSGYVKINLDCVPRYAHRLAWLLHYGKFPRDQIDHINMIRADNRIENLREATNSQNGQNRKAQSNNKSTGIKGVRRDRHGKYCVQIMVDRRQHYIGYFTSITEAKEAYNSAARRLHGDFHRP